MKKILMVGTSLDTKGGISSVVRVYADAGLFKRYRVQYLATHRDGGAIAKLGAMLGAYARFVAMLVTGQVGLLHVHVASRASFWRKSGFFLLAFLFRIPTILHLHGGGFAVFFEQECGPLRRAYIRYIFNHASRVLVLSSGWLAWVRSISSNERIATMFNPVLLPPALPAWSTRGQGSVLFLGKLGKAKGVYDLLQAGAMLRERCPMLRLAMGGDGDLAAMQEKIDALGVTQQVELLGWVQGEQKLGLLDSCRIYVLPSYMEGLPMSILEAMAHGVPVIATAIGGIPDAIEDGVEGYLLAPGDAAGLADCIERLLNDAALAQRMGAAGRRKVERHFCAAAVMPQLETMYTELGMKAV